MFLKDDVAFLKCKIKYYIIILMLTSAFSVPAMHSVCHVYYFHSWDDDRDKNDIVFLILWTKSGEKKVRDQSGNHLKM